MIQPLDILTITVACEKFTAVEISTRTLTLYLIHVKLVAKFLFFNLSFLDLPNFAKNYFSLVSKTLFLVFAIFLLDRVHYNRSLKF